MFSASIYRKFSPEPILALVQDSGSPITVGLPPDSAVFPKTSCNWALKLNSDDDANWASINSIIVDTLGNVYTCPTAVATVITNSQA